MFEGLLLINHALVDLSHHGHTPLHDGGKISDKIFTRGVTLHGPLQDAHFVFGGGQAVGLLSLAQL